MSTTPKGQLKDFSKPIANSYQPSEVEKSWDAYWEEQKFFVGNPDSKKEPYVMVIPPPNVTGTLHLGHALTVAIEDAVMRWNRMSGKEVVWVPGVDHAGIATQVVVEKKLKRERNLSRFDLGREDFLAEVWKWKNANADRIMTQIRRLGASVDWTRERFTMDEVCCEAVIEAFVSMHKRKKIYRANRMINWSCALRTAISAIEVEHFDVKKSTLVSVPGYEEKVEVGVLHSFAYKMKDPELGEIVVATTRMETMLGDVAVAVHPDDPRYQHLIGKPVVHPFIPDREMIVIGDGELVDMKFGTGCVKITPAHDVNDFKCGKRHKLPAINILNADGTINENGGQFAGQPRFTARVNVIQALTTLGVYKGKENNEMSIGKCSRSGDLIEPVLRPQWFVDTTSMAARAVAAVRNGDLKITPESNKSTWYHFLEEADAEQQQWCISRQLWWGHRIPAWRPVIPGKTLDTEKDDSWIVARSLAEAKEIAAKRFPGYTSLEQDPDVLDTWFSSGLFPFSVFQWPKQTKDLKKFFPGHLLETGKDILFFWVARMVMMSLDLMDSLPFTQVYLHSMVRDRFGRKMSKSLGNVVDPIAVIDGITLEALHDTLRKGNLDPREVAKAIKGQKAEFPKGIVECGADALRYGLFSYTGEGGKDIKLDINVVVSKREFCNKIWNVTKFCISNFDSTFERPTSKAELDGLVAAGGQFRDAWILDRLAHAVISVDTAFKNFRFAEACEALHHFWLYDLCAKYLEMIKPVLREGDAKQQAAARATLFTCMSFGLRMLHPIMPFVTEELWHRLPKWTPEGAGSICIAPFPKAADVSGWANPAHVDKMSVLQACGSAARSTRANLGLTSKKLDLFVHAKNSDMLAFANELKADLLLLTKSQSVTVLDADAKKPAGCMVNLINPDLEMHFPVVGLEELSKEVIKREKKQAQLENLASTLRQKMSVPGFQQSPQEVKDKLAAKLAQQEAEAKSLGESVAFFLGIMDTKQKQGYYSAKIKSIEQQIAKAQKQLKKCEKNLKKKPKNKKNQKQFKTLTDQIAGLEAQRAAVQEQVA